MTERIKAADLGATIRASSKREAREWYVHLAILDFLRLSLPEAVIHHSPNEVDISGQDAARAISKAKKLGMVVGWPDIQILWFGHFWTMEVKAQGNNPTEAQRACGAAIEAAGGRWGVVRSIDDAERLLSEWKSASVVSLPLTGSIS